MKTLLRLLGVAVVIALVWLVPTLGSMNQAATHLHATLDAVASHYASLGNAHAGHVATLAISDKSEAENLVGAFSAVSRATSFSEKQRAVAELQRQLGIFFALDRQHAPELKVDAHFTALQTEITGRGQASVLVMEYNKAALVAREQGNSVAGKLFSGLFMGGEPVLLWIDGTPDDAPMHL